MIYNSEKSISSIDEYISFIREYKTKWNIKKIWYRGQRIKERELKPNLYRDMEMSSKYKEQLKNHEIATLEYEIQMNLLKELEVFKSILNEKFSIPDSYNFFHYMFIGQHYGLKTPVLDWTTDPLVALYFSINKCSQYKDSSPIVFLLDPVAANKYYCYVKYEDKRKKDNKSKGLEDVLNVDNISNADEFLKKQFKDPNGFLGITCVETKEEVCPRVSRQSGVFTLVGPKQPLNYPWIQTQFNENNRVRTLGTSILINPESISEMLSDLDLLGVNEYSIYGRLNTEYDEICKRIVNDLSDKNK